RQMLEKYIREEALDWEPFDESLLFMPYPDDSAFALFRRCLKRAPTPAERTLFTEWWLATGRELAWAKEEDDSYSAQEGKPCVTHATACAITSQLNRVEEDLLNLVDFVRSTAGMYAIADGVQRVGYLKQRLHEGAGLPRGRRTDPILDAATAAAR